MNPNEVTIDTNVFEHIFNPQQNTNNHIDSLLGCLAAKRVVLCMDDNNRIGDEYKHRLTPLLKAMSDQGQRLNLLRYFLVFAGRHLIPVDFSDALMKCIKMAISSTSPIAEASDRVFVYVAIASDTVLVSNNPRHINNRASQLKRCAKAYGSKGVDFVDSQQALVTFGC